MQPDYRKELEEMQRVVWQRLQDLKVSRRLFQEDLAVLIWLVQKVIQKESFLCIH